MVRIKNAFSPVRATKATPKGNAGYDNPRENIDPHVRTQAVTSREGTIQNTPTNPKDIANKEYVDAETTTINLNLSKAENNIILNSFRIAINGSLANFQMQDGVVDEYEDETGIDGTASTNELYDATDDYYHNVEDGNALTFDGTTGMRVETASDAAFEPTSFSIAVWVRINSEDGNIQRIMAKYYSSGAPYVSYGIFYDRSNNNKLELFLGHTDNTWSIHVQDTAGLINDGDWHSVVAIFDSTANKSYIYVDGVKDMDVSESKEIKYNASEGIVIGNSSSAAASCLASVDEVAIFDRGLTSGEASDYHNAGVGIHLDPAAEWDSSGETIGDNLVGLWHLNDGSGTTAVDSSSTGKDGTLYSSPSWITGHVPAGSLDMTLISENTEAEATPSEGKLVVLLEDVDAVTLNTDLKAYVSRDDGTTYTQITLADEGDFDSTKKILTGTADISGQPSDKTMIYKITTHNNKSIRLHATGLLWD